MFKIEELILSDKKNENYIYKFTEGINYFKGKNSSGKTVFYELIDYMLGSSQGLKNKEWYADLKEVSMKIDINGKKFILTRTKEIEINYISLIGEHFQNKYPISSERYVSKLSNIFTPDEEMLNNIKKFTGERLTFRTFSMFNFLGENGQGLMRDFIDKCSDIKYSIRLNPLLNFLFNNHQEKISELEKKLNETIKEIEDLENKTNKYNFVKSEINKNIDILKLNIEYNGQNGDEVKCRLEKLKSLEENTPKIKNKSISELEVMFSNIDEQIKTFESSRQDTLKIQKENENRKLMLEKLNQILEDNQSLEYLVEPLKNVLNELDSTISFGQYLIKDEIYNKLKNQRKLLKEKIKKQESSYELYSLKNKEKAFILLQNYLSTTYSDFSEELNKKRELIKSLKSRIKELQFDDDKLKIKNLSEYITELYFSAKDISSVVEEDAQKDGYRIEYIKRGNILQPVVNKKDKENRKNPQNYETGSKARHTLTQLCGYMGFLKMLIDASIYPIMPIFAGDHLSQSFDKDNVKALGTVVNKAVEDIGKENIQIFLFDDESYEDLNISPHNSENLVKKDKEGNVLQTGFIPFYFPSK